MPIPSNISFATALDLGVLPASGSLDVHFSGTTYTTWWKITLASDQNIGGWFFGNLTGFSPETEVFLDAVTTYLNIFAINVPFQMPTVGGTTYYFKVIPNAGNPTPAILTWDFQAAPVSAIPAESVIVNDDSTGFSAAIISSITDYSVLNFIRNFPAGENGDRLQSGINAWSDFDTSTVQVYDALLNQIASNAGFGVDPKIRTCLGQNLFFTCQNIAGPNQTVKTINSAGAVGGTTYNMAINDVQGFAARNDGLSVLHTTTSTGSAINSWSLPGSVAQAVFASGVPGYSVWDILILSNDTVVASYTNPVTGDFKVRIYNSAGVQQNVFTIGTSLLPAGTFPRLAYGPDDTAFYVFWHPSTGISRFQKIRVSDGSVLLTKDEVEYELGVYQPSPTASPLSRSGVSFSCPFIVLPNAVTVGNANLTIEVAVGTIRIDKFTVPSGNAQIFGFIATGLTPSSFNLSDGQSETYIDIPAGSGYGIEETVPTNWVVGYVVNNGSPIGNISVAAGELVIVTVTNTLQPNVASGIYKIVPDKRQDTLWVSFDPESTRDVKIPNPFIKTALLGE